MKPALFLDRDGVINDNGSFVHKIENFVFMPGIFGVCRRYQDMGHLIFVVTNQAGIHHGYFTEDDFQTLTAWMVDQFAAHGVTITKVYHCPDYDPIMRKPAPGMILRAAREHGIDLARSTLIGDRDTDIAAGRAAGVGTLILVPQTNL